MSAILNGEQTEGLTRLAREIFKDKYESEIEARDVRITQLERLNKTLAEECDRLRREHASNNS